MKSKIIFGKMIDYLRAQRNLSMEAFGELVGKNKSTISRWIKGTRFPTIEEAENIAEQFNLPLNVLLFGAKDSENLFETYIRLEPLRQEKVIDFADHELEEQNKVINLDDYNKKDGDPRVDETLEGYLSAGTGEYLNETVAEPIRIPKSIIPEHPYDMILQVNGDSMEPMFENGEYVFIHKTKEIRSGQIGVFIIDGESYLKKVYINDDHLRLVSLNKEYEDLVFDSVNDINLIGTVVM